tara:strand:- start:7724 stop:10099 length:2376 start_codon:yes stop_codon:yes gene_type:complete
MGQSDSCNYSIKGKILDIDTKEPIPYVTLKVEGVDRVTMTNEQGEFLIDTLCTDNNVIIISCFGYCDSICENHHQHGKSPHIYLHKSVDQLKTVIIEAEEIKEKGTESIAQVILKKTEIRADPTQTLASLLAEQEGVTLISTGSNVQLPVIHGLYGNRILILNNGLKHGFQNWGTDHAPEIDISSANTITLIKGASGVRFGAEALGGVIIVEPNPLYLREPFYTEIGTGFQSNGLGINTNLETRMGGEKGSYFFNANLTKIGDRHTPGYSLTNSGKEEQSINLGTRYRYKNLDFKVYYSFVNQNLALLRASIAESGDAFIKSINADEPTFIQPFSYAINAPNQLTQHHFGKFEMHWYYSDASKLTFRAGTQFNKRKEFDVRLNIDKPIIDLYLWTTDYQLEWKHPDWLKLDGLIGVQYFNQNSDNNPGTGTTPFIPNYNTNRISAFLAESKRFGKSKFESGVRLDYELNNVRGRETNQAIFRDEYEFTNLTASLGYIIQLSENKLFRTNIGTAWRTPNMAELYSFGQHGFKTSFGLLRHYTNEEGVFKTDKVRAIAKSSVKTENGYKWVSEFQFNETKNRHVITAYAHYIENYIFDRPLAVIGTIRGPMPVFIIDQTNAFFVGADYSWKHDWSKQISGIFRGIYLWSKNVRENESLINQPPISLSYKLSWNQKKFLKLENSKVTIKPSYTFQQFQAPRTVTPGELINGTVIVTPDSPIFDFKDASAGYFLLDIGWSFTYKSLSTSITINNVLNTRYRDYLNEMRYFADELGTNVLFKFNYVFKDKKNKLKL